MKKILYILMSVMAVACAKVDIYDTDHPGQGKLTLNTDWANRSIGVAIPTSYTAESAGAKITLTGTTSEYPNLLAPGTYTLNLYNKADNVTVDGTKLKANVNAPQLGFQFWGSITQVIERDKDYTATVAMKQITKQLEFDLEITEEAPSEIIDITATLSGVAGAWDCTTNSPSGAEIEIEPKFISNGNHLTAMVRILGISGDKQVLKIKYTLGGTTKEETTDVSTQLATFNANKTEIARLTGTITLPTLVISNGSINDWVPGGSGESDANPKTN